MNAGLRLGCADCTTEIVVVRPPRGDVTLSCAGAPLVDVGAPRSGSGHVGAGEGGGALLGKRYEDEEAGLEVLCTTPGPGTLACDGRPMAVKRAKPLPSSD
jgi:hypothetical protein